ncbi:MAG: toll/interleukin-1 receptor domain-containing protein [Gammaproteobacteria bacterium]|nr:toll/interleukin-1 receptor domain-containing protein [Gammaproteobacteria bacterium]
MIARSLLSQGDTEEVRIFYSYARRDAAWREEIDELLPAFQWDVAVRTWYDGEIEPGTAWEPEIDRNLQAADLILLFVTQAFVESEYCRNVELPAALGRHANGEARVVPVIVESTDPDWRTLDFAHLQVLPQNGVPVSLWSDRQRGLEAVVQGLVDLVVRDGLHHDSRMRWHLHLDGDAAAFDHNDRLAMTTELRQFTGDATLRCTGVRAGSIVLAMESTQDALMALMQALNERALTLARWTVVRIVQLFGAGVRASSSVGALDRPAAPPDPERMLLPSRQHTPVLFRGFELNDAEPLKFESMVDTGSSNIEGEALQAEVGKLIDFFRTSLAVPEADMYVNLSPSDDAKLLSESLWGTRAGAALLEFDYRLKRLAATLLHPDLDTGRAFWKEVLRRCRATGVAMDSELATFQRVWIVPDKAVVFETTRDAASRIMRGEPDPPPGDTALSQPCAFVVEEHLKALTERQYLSGLGEGEPGGEAAAICDEIFREIVLPVVEADVNEGESFAELRQLYNGLILALWFGNRYASHPQVAPYIDCSRPDQLGVRIGDVRHWKPSNGSVAPAESSPAESSSFRGPLPNVDRIRGSEDYRIAENREYFERYLEIFKHGVFYAERDELIEGTALKQPRAYLAGGIDLRLLGRTLRAD